MKIAVYGSNIEDVPQEIVDKARKIGQELARRGHSIITGGCGGIPYEAVKAASGAGGKTIGFSPAINLESHKEVFGYPEEGHSEFVFIPGHYEHADNKRACFKFRNISSVAASDAAIIISGRSGTLNEFLIAFDLGKRIGVLEGSGGIADMIPLLIKNIKKETGAEIIFESDPVRLVERILDGPD
jgi:predicted Rossmann-fold nucleotide-binding protein